MSGFSVSSVIARLSVLLQTPTRRRSLFPVNTEENPCASIGSELYKRIRVMAG